MPNDVDPAKRDLSRRLVVAMVTPIILLVVLGLVLGRQILEMSDDARWVDRSDEVLAVGNETLKQMIDQETAVRAYLITDDRRFLDPYDKAHPVDGFVDLARLTQDNQAQSSRFAEARRRYEGWLASIKPIIDGKPPASFKTLDAMLERKQWMDSIRDSMQRALDSEQTVHRARTATSLASTAMTKKLFVGLILVLAVVLAGLSSQQLKAIAGTFGDALAEEKRSREAIEREAWLREAQTKLADALQGELSIEEVGATTLQVLVDLGQADIGAFFTRRGDAWERRAGHALDARGAGEERFAIGEGLVGQAAQGSAPLRVVDLPPDFLKLRSGTGETTPNEVVLVPARLDGATTAIVELGFLRPPAPRTIALLERIGDSVGLAVRSSEYKQQLRDLLEEARRQAEELQTQQEELRVANEEYEAQTTALKTAQQQLQTQQAELEQTNDNLLQQSSLLELRNKSLAETQLEIAAKAREVERASQFKSEFLSNMSHELRTPLNSSLILARILADNKDGNLSDEQVSFAETIYGAGNDLLTLISDILDLSKIESGKMEVRSGAVPIVRVRDMLKRTFEPMAREKGLSFVIVVGESAPPQIETDSQRLDQILKNLVANALKFTANGEVKVSIAGDADQVTFAVHDTGIGIPKDQQRIIFEAFRQADGTTNRKFGGTGLGLSISRELARLLGGDVLVASEPSKGSTFTLSLPRTYAGASSGPHPDTAAAVATPRAPAVEPAADTDEEEPSLEPGKRIVLLVEDDEAFANVLADVSREAGFQSIHATTANAGFRLAKRYAPMGIVLDIKLPDHTGLSVLDRLKRDPATRHIPVHIISSHDYTETALSMGAAGYLQKPVQVDQLRDALKTLEARSADRLRRVLIVDDDATLRESVKKLLGRGDVEIETAGSVQGALALLRERTFDCVVTDLGLPDQSGYDLLETMATEEPYSVPPVIVYTGRALTADEEQRLRKYSRSIIVKGARSPERLLDEVTLFLHQVESKLPVDQQRLLKQARHREAVFEERKILVVEDDVRNVFALTSLLEPKGARVTIARNGKEALSALEKDPTFDLVLMDVMMPEMDGLEATRHIRKDPRWTRLPIISLTAKAMPDDQEKCLAAGASDYIAKPLDVEMLLSLLRVWLPKS